MNDNHECRYYVLGNSGHCSYCGANVRGQLLELIRRNWAWN